MRKLIIIVLLLLTAASTITAQEKKMKYIKSHLGVGIDGGIGGVVLSPKANTGIGASFGLAAEYSYFFSRHFGVRSGVVFSHTQGNVEELGVESIVNRPLTVTTSSGTRTTRANYRYTVGVVDEHYYLTYVDIPLMLVVQGMPIDFTIDRYHTFHLAAGVKLSLPISTTATPTLGKASVALGPDLTGIGVEIDHEMPLDDYEPSAESYNISSVANTMFAMASIEAGVTLKPTSLSKGSFMVALFADYALNSRNIEGDHPSLITSYADQLTANGYLASANCESFRFFRVGLRLQYNMNW